jgi:hypothetical protein
MLAPLVLTAALTATGVQLSSMPAPLARLVFRSD